LSNQQATAAGPTVSPDILSHYTTKWDESKRLHSTVKGRLERERLRYFLAKYLPTAPARVVDVGGGPGVHASWLRSKGYQVDLVDPVPRHVEEATEAGIPAVLGDARCLPWEDRTFDVALLAGPMYHLPDEDDRALALREAVRVIRPDGLVAIIAINRAANLIGSAIANTLLRRREIVEEILDDGHSAGNERLANAHYHRITQLRRELNDAGLRPVTVHGLTGPGGWLTVAIDAHFRLF